MTTQPLERAAVPNLIKTPIISKDEKQRPNGLALWGFILMFIGVAIGVVGKKLMHEDIVTVVGILLSLAGMFLTVYPYLLPSTKKHDSTLSSQPEVLTPISPPKYLPEGNKTEYIPSVTERTTDLLGTPATTTPRRKEGGQ